MPRLVSATKHQKWAEAKVYFSDRAPRRRSFDASDDSTQQSVAADRPQLAVFHDFSHSACGRRLNSALSCLISVPHSDLTMQLKTDEQPNRLLNLICIVLPAVIICGALLAQIAGNGLGERIYNIIVVGVVILVPVAILGALSKSRKFKSATLSAQFGLLLGMAIALAYSAFIWHIDHAESALLISAICAMRGVSLAKSLRR